MKKIIKCICSVLTTAVLVFNSAMVPAMNVQAAEWLAGITLAEILKGLLVSAGVSILGYEVIDNATNSQKDDVINYLSNNDKSISKILSDVQTLDINPSIWTDEIESSGVYEGDGFKISISDEGYKFMVESALAASAASGIAQWAKSEENMFLTSCIDGLESSSYAKIIYLSVSNLCTNSISDIDRYYSSVVADKLAELGADDSNSMVVCVSDEVTDSYCDNSAFSEKYDMLHSGTAFFFLVIPFGYSYFVNGISLPGENSSYTSGQVYGTEAMINIPLKIESMGTSGASQYLKGTRPSEIKSVVYYPAYDDCEVRTINFSDISRVFSFYDSPVKGVFNYQNAVDNGCMVVHSISYSPDNCNIYVQKNEVTSNYIAPGSRTKYANTDEYVSMNFDATTADTLSSYTSLAQYISYAASLSKQLSDIKDAIEDSTEQNAVQTKQIIDTINAQTNTISSGLSDVITSVKVQTDAISDVLEATKQQTDAIGDVVTGINEHTLAITGPLQDILDAIQDISITIPSDLTLAIPEEKLNINVQVPDISTEVINQIEVTHDYPALQEAISGAIAAPLTTAFVPDEDKVRGFVGDFHNKFGFVDDMKKNIDNVQRYIFGVAPSPILKIPLMKVESKYDYGFGEYLIVDVSWYEPYKPYGDLIILAFAWIMFIWSVFLSLPGIISGAPGSFWGNFSSIGTQPGIDMNNPTMIEDKRRGR